MYILNHSVKNNSKAIKDKAGYFSLWAKPATLFHHLPNALELLKLEVASTEDFYMKKGSYVNTHWVNDLTCLVVAKNETQIFRITSDEPED